MKPAAYSMSSNDTGGPNNEDDAVPQLFAGSRGATGIGAPLADPREQHPVEATEIW
jgi:hypothetical protein